MVVGWLDGGMTKTWIFDADDPDWMERRRTVNKKRKDVC